MDKAIADRWVAALRSGNYKQGNAHLRDEQDRYCCLGVLCNLLMPDRWTKRDTYYVNVTFCASLSIEHLDMARMYSRYGEIQTLRDRRDEVVDLAVLNDEGMPFHQIADLIEYFWADL